MTAKQLAILLAILLAISIYFNIRCEWGEKTPEFSWSQDSIPPSKLDSMKTTLNLCSQSSANQDSCIKVGDGKEGGSVMLEKLGLISINPTEVNCLSYFYSYTQSAAGALGSMTLVFHGDYYDAATHEIKAGPGPYYSSDMLCPTYCPGTR